MAITSPTTAERNGQAWGARARDWSEVEAQQAPTYEEAIREAARQAIVEALAPCRTPEGGYRIHNEWHYLIARAG